MERLCVLVNGFCGAICGAFAGIWITITCVVLDIQPQRIVTMYLILLGPEVLGAIIGFWLAVRKDWWRMKREW